MNSSLYIISAVRRQRIMRVSTPIATRRLWDIERHSDIYPAVSKKYGARPTPWAKKGACRLATNSISWLYVVNPRGTSALAFSNIYICSRVHAYNSVVYVSQKDGGERWGRGREERLKSKAEREKRRCYDYLWENATRSDGERTRKRTKRRRGEKERKIGVKKREGRKRPTEGGKPRGRRK